MTGTTKQAEDAQAALGDKGDGADDRADGTDSTAHTLFANVREEIEGLVDLAGHEWDLLKAAIAKHL